MAKWISDGSIICDEVHGSRRETGNAQSGFPSFNVTLEIPRGSLNTAIAKLIGNPEEWPYDSQFQYVKCQSYNVHPDKGEYATDADGQILNAENPHIVDFTYAPRLGRYVTLGLGCDVYIEDKLTPRNESRPLNNLNYVWGTQVEQGIPADPKRPLTPQESPMKYEAGDTLIHKIEGFSIDTAEFNNFIGTCNNADYDSPNLQRRFLAGTLLLKNVEIESTFTFPSYRDAFAVALPLIDFAGLPCPTVTFVYEYKKIGWNLFYRSDADSANFPPGNYYIRHAAAPYALFRPFPLSDHTDWL